MKHEAYVYKREEMRLIAIIHYDTKEECVEMLERLYNKPEYGIQDDCEDLIMDKRAPHLYAGID